MVLPRPAAPQDQRGQDLPAAVAPASALAARRGANQGERLASRAVRPFPTSDTRPPLSGPPQKVKKDHKKYAKQFEAKDRVLQSRVSKEILGKRRELMEEFLAYRRLNAERYQEQTPYRRELRNGTCVSSFRRVAFSDRGAWRALRIIVAPVAIGR